MAKKETKAALMQDTGTAQGGTVSAKTAESKNQKAAKEIFNKYPNSGELYFTSDGLAFFVKNDALNHARGLGDKKIETIKK